MSMGAGTENHTTVDRVVSIVCFGTLGVSIVRLATKTSGCYHLARIQGAVGAQQRVPNRPLDTGGRGAKGK